MLARCHGLAITSATVAAKLRGFVGTRELLELLDDLRAEADQTRSRCLLVEGGEEELAHANSTAATGLDLLDAWFKADTDPVEAWTFLVMVEAAEVAVWKALAATANGEVAELAAWALPLHERHLDAALAAVKELVRIP
jgi:hypothetical protein